MPVLAQASSSLSFSPGPQKYNGATQSSEGSPNLNNLIQKIPQIYAQRFVSIVMIIYTIQLTAEINHHSSTFVNLVPNDLDTSF